MKQGRTLSELAVELERQAGARRDYIAPQGKVEAVVNGREVEIDGINGGGYGITGYAHKQFAEVLGIPGRYYERMRDEQPWLLAANINTWLQADPGNKRMIRTLDRDVRAVLSPKYRPLDNYELAKAVLPKLVAMEAQIISCELTETRMYLKAILPSLSDELPEGMTWGNGHNRIAEYSGEAGRVVAAIVVSNSEVGAGTLRVEPSVFTTWCTNLAVMKESAMRKYHVGRASEATDGWEIYRDATRAADDKAFFMKVSDVTDVAFRRETFAAAVASIRRAAADKIESRDITKVVEVAVKELSLPPATQGSILTYLAQGGDLSRWGLSSAITATANNAETYELATELEHAGGEVLALEWRKWAGISTAA